MKFLQIIKFEESRKVGFGIWLFILSNVFLVVGKLSSSEYMTLSLFAGSLVGGGTLMDKYLEKKKK